MANERLDVYPQLSCCHHGRHRQALQGQTPTSGSRRRDPSNEGCRQTGNARKGCFRCQPVDGSVIRASGPAPKKTWASLA